MAHRQLEDERDALYEESDQDGQPRHICALFVWGGGSETRIDDELVDARQTFDSAYCSAFVNRRRDVDPLLQAAAAKSSNTNIHDAQPRLSIRTPRLLQCRNEEPSNRALHVIRRRICFGCSGTGFASKISTTGGDVGTGQDKVSQAGSERR